MEDLVSVLMCVYDTPISFLKEAIESILDQTYENIEFIIVDDCSKSLEVIDCLRKYSDLYDRILVVRNPCNIGLTKSLNVGLEYCKGNFIARMDSDDIALPDRIEKQIRYLKDNRDVAMVGSDIICFGDNMNDIDTSMETDSCCDYEFYKVSSLLRHSGPPHPTFVFRTSFLNEHGIKYRENILKAQDYGIMVDILKNGGVIRKIHEPLLRYRIHEKQITASSEIEQKVYQLKVSYDYIKFLIKDIADAEALSISMLGCMFQLDEVVNAIKENDLLAQNCDFSQELLNKLENANVYLDGQRKLLSINKKEKLFDEKLLREELCYYWWKMALHNTIRKHRLWGFGLYTLNCYKCVLKRKIYGKY
ncbi:glycosyltransferase family 2 protein [Butyrivibrio sp. AE2032]|uniref:glycosyltransferase family 2 protein n=1 Tax=Butyrivibrio sp. AE2032 TaxID=1458463 RepID=UPI0005560F90|nr:glycosyltransferase [Butyrivibrio sp. AE2032]